jgi:hypothetical protein
MLNWTTGEGTAKYWTSKLLIEMASIDDDQAVMTKTDTESVFSQAFRSMDGRRWILVINKRYASVEIVVEGCTNGESQIIDETTGFDRPPKRVILADRFDLNPFAVAFISMPFH